MRSTIPQPDGGALDPPPMLARCGPLRPLLATVREVVAARLAAWEALKPALTEQDPTRQAQLMEAYTRASAAVAERLKAEAAEVEALNRT